MHQSMVFLMLLLTYKWEEIPFVAAMSSSAEHQTAFQKEQEARLSDDSSMERTRHPLEISSNMPPAAGVKKSLIKPKKAMHHQQTSKRASRLQRWRTGVSLLHSKGLVRGRSHFQVSSTPIRRHSRPILSDHNIEHWNSLSAWHVFAGLHKTSDPWA